MDKKVIVWITFNAFMDTDLYVVRELARLYRIEWHIIRSKNDKFDYLNELQKLKEKENLSIQLHICGKRLRNLSCAVYFSKLLNEIKQTEACILYTSMAGAPFFIPVLAAKANLKHTILAIHNVHVPKGGTAYWFFKFYNTFSVLRFKNFQTFSLSQYKELKRIAPGKNILYAPFILKDYGLPKKERIDKTITFLNFGNIRPYKRIDVLIKAAQIAYERTGKIIKVIIAGKCDEWGKYQQLIKYGFLFDIRLGRVNNEDVADLFNEADYFVAPYQDIAQSGSSIVAINYDKPIIASRLPAFEEYIKDKVTGFLINPADVEDLTNTMVSVIESHESNYGELIENLKFYRNQNFTTSEIVQKYARFFDEISK